MDESHDILENTIVFRGIRKSRWIADDGEVLFIAFVLESKKGELDLSLFTEMNCSQNYCTLHFNTCYGEIILKADAFTKIKGANLKVTHTPRELIPSHISVIGLPPFYDTEEEDLESEARNIADEIAKSVINVNRLKPPYKKEAA